MVDLKTEVVGGHTESAGADRAADRQERVGDHRHGQLLRVRRHQDRMPFRAGADLGDPAGIGLDDADGIQAAGVDDHAILDLGLAEKRMPLSAHRHLDPVTVRILDELGDVLCIAGPQHGERLLVHDVTEVVGRRLQGGIVEIELAAQVLEVIAQ
jgi:hypothetical protein